MIEEYIRVIIILVCLWFLITWSILGSLEIIFGMSWLFIKLLINVIGGYVLVRIIEECAKPIKK